MLRACSSFSAVRRIFGGCISRLFAYDKLTRDENSYFFVIQKSETCKVIASKMNS